MKLSISALTKKKPKAPKLRRDRRPRTKDYGYGNARTRGMKSNLLGAAFFEELMSAGDLNKMIQLLLGTEYGPDLEARLIEGHTVAVVDDALKDNMVRTFDKIMGFINDEARLLTVTLLGRWDLFNVKTIIRGKHMRLKPETIIDSLLPVGEMTQVELRELAGLEDVLAVTDTLWTWGSPYSIPLRESRAGVPEGGRPLRSSSWPSTGTTRSGQRSGSRAAGRTTFWRGRSWVSRSTPPTSSPRSAC